MPLSSLLAQSTALLALAVTSGTALAADPQGVWLTQDKDAVLTIAACNGLLCGRVIWLESATEPNGSLRLDQYNPDPEKQGQGVCGLVVINDLRPSGQDTWEGSVYDPRDGKTYSGSVTVLSDDSLSVRAYIALPIFGRNETWTRVSASAADGMGYDCHSRD
jgi:Uncharacterized protein conserved in bacteria